MAKINTTNYQPVTAWNGTQDLFVVEQPDGTKVATPEQVKQYVEAGDFEATGEIKDGHGNILAKKADQTTITIPVFTPSQAGWRRICKIKPVNMQTADGMIYVGGFWSNGQPPSATVAVSLMVAAGSLTLLSSAFVGDKRITAMRLINATGAEFWLDVYFLALSSGVGPFKLTFTGDIAVSDIQNPIPITTDSTAATDEISLNQKVNGTVLTDKSISGTVSLNTDDGWRFDSGVVNIVQKQGNIAWLSSYIYNTNNLTPNTVYEIGTLPAGFVPSKMYKFPIYLRENSNLRGVVTIEDDGKIYYRSIDGSKWAIYTTIIYPLN